MKYIIIGLGNYGSVLAEELSALGHEVIGVDTNERRVDVLKDKIATSFIIDATDEQSLSVLPLKDVDVVIVAIGENFGASIRVVALLKKNGVKHIYARAVDEVHKTVLEAFNLDSILKVSDLSLEKEFNIKIIALVKGKQVFNSLGISIMEHAVENKFEEDYLLEEEDRLVCYGKYKDFMDFWKAL